MREIERLMIVSRIKKFMNEEGTLQEKKNELKELMNNPKVKQYLELLKDIKSLEDAHNSFDSLDEVIEFEFGYTLRSKTEKEILPCTHDIWIYNGSFYWYQDPLHEHSNFLMCKDENTINFSYNEYVCLECGEKRQEKKDWKSFEERHTVLKNKNCFHTKKLGEDYRKLYFQLLFNNKVSIAREKLIEEFNKDCEKDAKKYKEKVKVKR